jgi:RNA polymerase sigma-70 factor (family 1)
MGIRIIHNEKELLIRVAQGDEKAFSDLFYGYHTQLWEYTSSLIDSQDLAEEIVHDVFVKIWLNREVLSTIDRFTSYLFILTRNYTLNCIRKIARERRDHDKYGQEMSAADDDPAETTLHADLVYLSLIDRAVAQLPPQQQKVFMLRQTGLKNPEIARQMQISVDSVKKYQQWALKSVSTFVKAHMAISILFLASR